MRSLRPVDQLHQLAVKTPWKRKSAVVANSDRLSCATYTCMHAETPWSVLLWRATALTAARRGSQKQGMRVILASSIHTANDGTCRAARMHRCSQGRHAVGEQSWTHAGIRPQCKGLWRAIQVCCCTVERCRFVELLNECRVSNVASKQSVSEAGSMLRELLELLMMKKPGWTEAQENDQLA